MAPTPLPPLDFKIPSSSTTVSVSIINSTSSISNLSLSSLFTNVFPQLPCLDNIPCYSFLITHPSSRSLLFDLGVRKDFENLTRPFIRRAMQRGWKVDVEKDVREILEENGVKGESIEAIIWSHWHWDHIGDASTFPSSTAVIVGPGFTKAFIPGCPTNPNSPIQESDYAGRELREISFEEKDFKIGNYRAHDYFGDGSFYLLDSPGHAIGHMCGLARVKLDREGDHFILMGGDTCHHSGEFRPSKYLPLPDSIPPSHPPHSTTSNSPCPGTIFEHLLTDGDATKPIFTILDGSTFNYDSAETKESIRKVVEADGNANIFCIMAHDGTLLDVVEFFPAKANEFKEKGWMENGMWRFLYDFVSR